MTVTSLFIDMAGIFYFTHKMHSLLLLSLSSVISLKILPLGKTKSGESTRNVFYSIKYLTLGKDKRQ